MGTQKFRGAGGAGAVGTPLGQTANAGSVSAHVRAERRRPGYVRGFVLALDVERRLREVRARVAAARALDDADDIALVRACR
jgi:hypothetical protein